MGHKMYVYVGLLILAFVIILAFFVNMSVSNFKPYVVKVNDEEVTLKEFKVYMKIVKRQLELQAQARGGITSPEALNSFWTNPIDGNDPVVYAREISLNSAIRLRIITQKARELGVQLTDKDEILVQEKMKSKEVVQEIKEFGIEEKEIEKTIRESILADKLTNFITRDVNLTDEEFNRFLSENNDLVNRYITRHILFKTIDENQKELPRDKQKDIQKLALEVYEKAKEGQDFSKLAQKYSEDTKTKENGGLYVFYKGEPVKEYENAVLNLTPGQLSQPIRTEYGYHIIKLEAITKPEGEEFERLKKMYRDAYAGQKRSDYFEEQFNKWKQQSEIKTNYKLINSVNIKDL